MFEGVPTFPEADRLWAIVAKYKVNAFYTGALRARLPHVHYPIMGATQDMRLPLTPAHALPHLLYSPHRYPRLDALR
jgi:hypothetical protein